MTEPWADEPSDGSVVRAGLLAHIDPIYVVEIVARCAQQRESAATDNALLVGMGVDRRLQPLFMRLLRDGLAPPFLDLAMEVIEQAGIAVGHAGLEVLHDLGAGLSVAAASSDDPAGLAGRINAPDAVCDLLLQPMQAFGGRFASLSDNAVELASRPEVAERVYYRTNRLSYGDARLEVLALETLGLNIEERPDDGRQIMNVP